MSNNITYFDVNRIIKIMINSGRIASYVFYPDKPKTYFFGLVKSKKIRPGGWLNLSSPFSSYYTKEELIGYGYQYRDGRFWTKPQVVVYLEFDKQISREFNNFEEASLWADDLKFKSNNVFEVVIND